MLAPANVGVELVRWNEAGPDAAGDRPQLPVADQNADLFLGAVELGRNLADGQGRGPVHARTLRRNAGSSGPYNRAMRRVLDVGLVVGFLAVDFLFFHDVFKAGEVTTVPQYMTGFLSILVFAVCAQSLAQSVRR